MSKIWDILNNSEAYLRHMMPEYGGWIFLIISLVIFCETGLIVFGILPGDSLLFASGSFAAAGMLNPILTLTLLPLAAFLGDQANYGLGKWLGKRLFAHPRRFLFNQKTAEKAKKFYAVHGPWAITFGRFIPVVRSIIPFAAATADMPYMRFVRFSIIGSAAWSYLFLLSGYFFGRIPFVRNHLWLVIGGVVIISFLPSLIGMKNRKK